MTQAQVLNKSKKSTKSNIVLLNLLSRTHFDFGVQLGQGRPFQETLQLQPKHQHLQLHIIELKYKMLHR